MVVDDVVVDDVAVDDGVVDDVVIYDVAGDDVAVDDVAVELSDVVCDDTFILEVDLGKDSVVDDFVIAFEMIVLSIWVLEVLWTLDDDVVEATVGDDIDLSD